MNIFILSRDPVEAARLQCDKHVVKMIVESAQMLSTAHRVLDGVLTVPVVGRKTKSWKLPGNVSFYKSTHVNHPSNVWSRETSSNYDWHYEHFCALCDEYTHRYGKIHATDKLLREKLKEKPKNIRTHFMTPFAVAMTANPECMLDDPVESYRAYYKTKSTRFSMVWTKRETPTWME